MVVASMGSICSTIEIVWQGSCDMPGVPCHVAEATFADLDAAPTFIPHLLTVEMIRGNPAKVGACWLERRKVGKHQVVLRKTITKRSANPFTHAFLTELMETDSWTMPNFIGTTTLIIEPMHTENGLVSGCSVHWTDAIVSSGMLGRIMSVFCVPCLKSLWITHAQEEWRYYYEESLRRTTKLYEVKEAPLLLKNQKWDNLHHR